MNGKLFYKIPGTGRLVHSSNKPNRDKITISSASFLGLHWNYEIMTNEHLIIMYYITNK